MLKIFGKSSRARICRGEFLGKKLYGESFGIVFLGCFCYKTGGNAARFFDRAFCIHSMLKFFGKSSRAEFVGENF